MATLYLPRLYYGGIDESNHGKIPEVYSLVLSSNPEQIIKSKNILQKKRRLLPIPKKFYETLEDFRFLFLEEKIIKTLGQNALKSTVIAHLLASADINPRRIKVLIDGFLQSIAIEEAAKIYYNITGKHIISRKLIPIEHGDQWYPLINSADMLSYLIYSNRENQERLPLKNKLAKLPLELRC